MHHTSASSCNRTMTSQHARSISVPALVPFSVIVCRYDFFCLARHECEARGSIEALRARHLAGEHIPLSVRPDPAGVSEPSTVLANVNSNTFQACALRSPTVVASVRTSDRCLPKGRRSAVFPPMLRLFRAACLKSI